MNHLLFHGNWATLSAEEDHMRRSKAPEQLPCGEIFFFFCRLKIYITSIFSESREMKLISI